MHAQRLRVLALFSVAYFASYVFRGVNLGFAPLLTRELGLSATDLGTLTSLYFLGFASAQLPAGVLLDRLGARRVTAGVMLVAAAGALVFGTAHGFAAMAVGRLLIGIGVSVCLGGAFKATAQHFALGQLTLVNGVVMAVGGLGGVVVGMPLTWLLSMIEWRTVCISLGLFTAAVAAAIWAFAPDARESHPQASMAEQLKGTWHIVSSHAFWRLATFSSLTQSVFYAMQSLWVGAFLRDVTFAGASANYANSKTASLVSVIGVAFIAGNVGFGALARTLERRGVSVQRFSGITMAAFVVVQLAIAARVPLPGPLLWALYGALGGTGILTYSVLAQHFPARMIGRVNTTFTLVIFLGIFALQMAIGAALGHWSMHAGRYPVPAHVSVWIALIALQAVAAAWYFAPMRQPLRSGGNATGDGIVA